MALSYERVGGTGSRPPRPKGLQRKTRRAAKSEPLTAPWVRIASSAYREHVGKYRHCPPNHPDSADRYSAIAPSMSSRIGAPALHMRSRADVMGASLHARVARSSLRSDPGFGRPGWLRAPPGRCRVLPSLAARPHGAPPEGPAGLGSAAPRRRSSYRRPARTPRSRGRGTVPPAARARACLHGRPSGSPRSAPSRSAGDGEPAAALAAARGEDRPASSRPHP
jgi:hypothetical protein